MEVNLFFAFLSAGVTGACLAMRAPLWLTLLNAGASAFNFAVWWMI